MTRASASRPWIGTLLLAAILMVAGPAGADDPAAESEPHIQRGIELRRLGRNGEALVEFQRAYDVLPTPRARAQIALALQALGDWLGAEGWLEQALQEENDPWIEQYRGVLVGARATIRAHLGRLYVETNVKEGEVLVNGVLAHSLPLSEPIRVNTGALEVVVQAPSFASAHRIVSVAADTDVHETFTLVPLAAPSPSPRPSVAGLGPRAAIDSSDASPRSRWGGYVALGGAGALTVGGVVAWRVREDNVAVWNDDSRCLRPGSGETRGQQCGGYETAANVALGVEIAAYAAAAVSAGAGLWLLWPRRRPAPQSIACAPALGVAISCGGRF
jgi:hypothetical protein